MRLLRSPNRRSGPANESSKRRIPLRYRWLADFLAILVFGILLHPFPLQAAERDAPKQPVTLSGPGEVQRQFRLHVEAAQVLFRAENWQQAITEYLAAYQLHPQSLLLFNVAQSYRKDQKLTEALRYYEEFLSIDPHNPLAPECEAQIRAMRTQIEAEQVSAERRQAELVAKQRAEEAAKLTQEKLSLEQKVAEEKRTTEALKKQPVYKKKWFWVVLGGAVLTAGAVGIVVWQTLPQGTPLDGESYNFNFPH